MSYEDLLSQIYQELPQLRGQLASPRVVYVKAQGKVYITFDSNVLVEEATFLKMESILRRIFPQKPLALRVVSPGLKDDFLRNIGAYKQVLTDFLKRNYPASVSWMSQIDWRCEGDRITLTFPDSFSLEYMGRQNVAARLAQAVKDIFSAEVKVELTVAGDQEARLAALRAEREKEQAISARELAERYERLYGRHTSPRAVGGAVGKNPLPIFLPCHRVLGADGSLTGYAGGLEWKAWLLELERDGKSIIM